MSSLVFLGFSVVIFVVTFGIMYTLVPMVLGAVFSAMPTSLLNAQWSAINTKTQGVLSYLVPLVPTIGIFIFVIKVMMVASVRGRD